MAAAQGNRYSAKDRAITRAFEACFEHKSRVDQVDALFEATMKVTENAIAGDLASFKEMADRIQGKAAQSVAITDPDGGIFKVEKIVRQIVDAASDAPTNGQ